MKRRRFVDSHVHLWDVHLHPRYKRFPKAGDTVLGFTFAAPWREQFLWDEYSETVASYDLVKWVHVSAVNDTANVDQETRWVTQVADEAGTPPYAIVGSIDYRLPSAELEAAFDRQLAHPAFRGLRMLGEIDYGSPGVDQLFRLLTSHNLVFDVASSHVSMDGAARKLARHPELVAVLEHTGLPLTIDDAGLDEWYRRVKPFADLPNVFLKLYGLGSASHNADPDVFRRFYGGAIDLFGPDRCMFGSNFRLT
jgi:L-fuconolactonase